MRPLVAILAGGASRRMGADKALLEHRGRTILTSIIEAARAASLDVIVVGRTEVPGITGVDRWLADEQPGEGPLAALATALRATARETILVACDMPLLDRRALSWLADLELDTGATTPGEQGHHAGTGEHAALGDHSAAGIIIRNHDRLEPLFARYRPECLRTIDALLSQGRRSLGALIDTLEFTIIDAPDWLVNRLTNVNTPADLDSLSSE